MLLAVLLLYATTTLSLVSIIKSSNLDFSMAMQKKTLCADYIVLKSMNVLQHKRIPILRLSRQRKLDRGCISDSDFCNFHYNRIEENTCILTFLLIESLSVCINNAKLQNYS